MDRTKWVCRKFKEVSTDIGGSTPKTDKSEYWGGSHYWVTPAELDGSKYISKTERSLTDKAVSETNLTLLPTGTVLLSSRAPIGKVCITQSPMYCNQGFKNIVCSDLLYNEFVYYYLLHNVDYLQSLGTGATFKEISKKVVENVEIIVPSLSDQHTIVAELDKLNDVIALKRKQLADLDSLAQSLFCEMFGDPVVNEKGWEVKKLNEVSESITDGDHMPPPKSESGIPFLTISDINKETRELDFSNTFFVPREYYDGLKEERKARINDLLYTVTGSYGIPVIVKTDKQFCFQRHIALIRPRQEILTTTFLCFWALCPSVKREADRVATGIAQKTVGLNSIRQFDIILPPLPLQQSFAEKIAKIEAEKQRVKSSLKDLETLLASRMQFWFDN